MNFFLYCRWSHIPLSSSHNVRRSIGDHHPVLHCRQQSSASILLDQRFFFGGTKDFFFTSITFPSLFRTSFIFVDIFFSQPHYYEVSSGTNRVIGLHFWGWTFYYSGNLCIALQDSYLILVLKRNCSYFKRWLLHLMQFS